jgi:hypothetical protein
MPKISKTDKPEPSKKEEDSEIQNYYKKIPKKYLESANNPNFSKHQLKIPFRMCIVAPSGSGKTNFLMNLLSVFSVGKGTFSSITIITKNSSEPLYNWLVDEVDGITISEGLENTPELDSFDKSVNHLLVWDDLVLSKDLRMVEEYYIRARKLNVSVVFISQSFFKIPKIIRNNCSYLVLLKLSGQREVNLIMSEFGLGVTKPQLLKIYEYATAEKFSPLIIDFEADKEKRFRKGFLEILNPAEYIA